MQPTAPRNRGFTLLEVMITVCIVGILAAIALPQYQDAVRRGKLIDMTVRLGDYRAQQEKWFLDNRTYQAVPPNGTDCGIPSTLPAANDPFQLVCVANSATTYTVTATGRPAAGMPIAFVYIVDQANIRSSTGPAGWNPGVGCWALRKDGSCQ